MAFVSKKDKRINETRELVEKQKNVNEISFTFPIWDF